MRDHDKMDWGIFEIEGVEDIAENAAKAVVRNDDYTEHVEFEDLRQEALIMLAEMGADVRRAASGEGSVGLGAIKYRVQMDLVNLVNTDVLHRQKSESYEARYSEAGDGDDYSPAPSSTVIRQEVGGYTEELVETLMPAIWDRDYCYGMQVENAPDADMPRVASNKATGNTLAAHIADIKVGWEKAPLRVEERRALLLGYGLDWRQKDIAFNQGVTQKTISERLSSGVDKILSTLNGGIFYQITGEQQAAA